MNEYIQKINELAKDMNEVRIMEVCGGHTNVIMRYGIREVLASNIKLISGPGCPVCVTSQYDIDCMIKLALHGVKVATYGDMVNVPGTKMSLRDAQSQGADIKIIYCTDQIIDEKDRVFFAVGFETTAPMTARLLQNGIKVFCAHKLIPPAMKILVKEMKIDGFIDPGHVSTIIGENIWSNIGIPVPQVFSGFKPEQVVKAIYTLLDLIKNNEIKVINEYPEVVFPKGNIIARNIIEETMDIVDSEWRGIGVIPKSGLAPKNSDLDARIIYRDILKNVVSKENKNCRCGEIVRGLIEPKECKLFGTACTPENPQGACMVSETEGACAIAFKYGKSLSE
jgi:hydrogenase expression/formation protein HypD